MCAGFGPINLANYKLVTIQLSETPLSGFHIGGVWGIRYTQPYPCE